VGTCPHQVLAATLTLSQPVGVDHAHPIMVSTPILKASGASGYVVRGTNGTKFVNERVLIQTNLCACRPDLFHELSKLKAYFWGLH
jgi:hypothetical protein